MANKSVIAHPEQPATSEINLDERETITLALPALQLLQEARKLRWQILKTEWKRGLSQYHSITGQTAHQPSHRQDRNQKHHYLLSTVNKSID